MISLDRRNQVTYWIALVGVAVAIVVFVLFLFRDRFGGRRERWGEALSPRPTPQSDVTRARRTPALVSSATSAAVMTPQTSTKAQTTPTSSPARSTLREDTDRLRQLTADWIYRGYGQMAGQAIGRFSRSKTPGQTFAAAEGDEVEGVKIEKLDRGRVLLRLGEATQELPMKPEPELPEPAMKAGASPERRPAPPGGPMPQRPRREPGNPPEIVPEETEFQ